MANAIKLVIQKYVNDYMALLNLVGATICFFGIVGLTSISLACLSKHNNDQTYKFVILICIGVNLLVSVSGHIRIRILIARHKIWITLIS